MSNILFPPYLQEGDEVIILSPSGKIDKNFLKGARKRLESWGLKVSLGKNSGASSGRYAGTVKQRLSDLQAAMDNEKIKAIFCSRGGYGAIHLIDKIDFTAFHKCPKWLIGYSDITLLHALFQFNGYASLHAPMARHLSVEAADENCTQQIKAILFGKNPEYQTESHKLNRTGKASGILRGGNLSVLYSLRGTTYDLPAPGSILFIEDIGENPYHVDRMMNNLQLGGILENLAGLIIGQFTKYEEDKSMGKDIYESIADMVKPYDYPVCFNFPVGHVTQNYPLVCGSEIELTISKKAVVVKTKETKPESLF